MVTVSRNGRINYTNANDESQYTASTTDYDTILNMIKGGRDTIMIVIHACRLPRTFLVDLFSIAQRPDSKCVLVATGRSASLVTDLMYDNEWQPACTTVPAGLHVRPPRVEIPDYTEAELCEIAKNHVFTEFKEFHVCSDDAALGMLARRVLNGDAYQFIWMLLKTKIPQTATANSCIADIDTMNRITASMVENSHYIGRVREARTQEILVLIYLICICKKEQTKNAAKKKAGEEAAQKTKAGEDVAEEGARAFQFQFVFTECMDFMHALKPTGEFWWGRSPPSRWDKTRVMASLCHLCNAGLIGYQRQANETRDYDYDKEATLYDLERNNKDAALSTHLDENLTPCAPTSESLWVCMDDAVVRDVTVALCQAHLWCGNAEAAFFANAGQSMT